MIFIALLVVVVNFSTVQAKSECPCCSSSHVIGWGRKGFPIPDMDTLMDIHFPTAETEDEDPKGVVGRTLVKSEQSPGLNGFENPGKVEATPSADLGTLDRNSVILKKFFGNPIGLSLLSRGRAKHGNDRRPVASSRPDLHQSELINHLFLSNVRNLKDSKRSAPKRSARKSKSVPASQIYRKSRETRSHEQQQFADDSVNSAWSVWRSSGRLINLAKRDIDNRRTKLSTMWEKKMRKDLMDTLSAPTLKEMKPVKGPETVQDPYEAEFKKSRLSGDIQHSPVDKALPIEPSEPTSGTNEALSIKSFRIKSNDGREFSFSASVTDVKELMSFLTKPGSTILLERIPQELNSTRKSLALWPRIHAVPIKRDSIETSPGSAEIDRVTEQTSDGIRSKHKNAGIPCLTEIETNSCEDVLMMDIPVECLTPSCSSTCSTTSTTCTPACSKTTTDCGCPKCLSIMDESKVLP